MNKPTPRVAELHRLAAQDYAKGELQRAAAQLPAYAPAAPFWPSTEPSDLAVAIRVAQQMLDSGDVLKVREALRLLLRSLGAEPTPEPGPAEEYTPVGPGCGAPATVRFEGYSPRNGLAHGSLDLAVYACTDHTTQARTKWLDGLMPYRTATAGASRCGERFDFTKLGGGQ
ncbi:hypothetical protein [Streptomyces griseorubiginosus]|uniref:hypothetical protein n=1 Tax=Streptomyces griseorubiginosus TaxID=67304 RepID=UPI002E81D0AD|nr:hypothetical protein [Streptomyces griseorubiginosus]WUB45307.1 hypothetical protein OHN19_18930 [Streptomyces griseorubiginosus]WUB53824.1 hypothetical protein OG942_18925 [Streptomyces griseorubiginosus]